MIKNLQLKYADFYDLHITEYYPERFLSAAMCVVQEEVVKCKTVFAIWPPDGI